jgi:hypothetical protein
MITNNKLDELQISCILREVKKNMFRFTDAYKSKIAAIDDS